MTLDVFLSRLNKVDIVRKLENIIEDTSEVAANLNRSQLLKGENNEGRGLTPRYTEDGYFKTQAAAQRYAQWKQSINPEAPYNTPTLFINGQFHSTIRAYAKTGTFTIMSSSSIADDLQRKYRGMHLGLNPISMGFYTTQYLHPNLIRDVARDLGV